MLLVFCSLVFLVVFAIMLVSVWRHHRLGAAGKTNFHDSVAVELGWTLAPGLIVAFVLAPAVRVYWVS